MNDILDSLRDVISQRKNNPTEGSYTCYLFEQGLDKILKKCGEETAEVIIAAKNAEKSALTGEISDLIYHVLVLMAQTDISLDELYSELARRREKIGNLKPARPTAD